MPTGAVQERIDALDRLNREAWPLDANARDTLARDVLAWSGAHLAPRSSHRVLTGDEIRELARRPGHSIGAHTVHHLALTLHPAETKRLEICTNKAALERLLGQPVHLFAYPYGELDSDAVAVVNHAGFHAAFTVEPGLVSAGMNRLLLPRFEMTPRDHGAFALRIGELFEPCPARL